MSLRWAWSIFAAFLTAATAVVLAISLVDIEQEARRAEEGEQLRMTASVLSRALSMPMMAGSRAEVDALLEGFLEAKPGAMIYLHWAKGDSEQFGSGAIPEAVISLANVPESPVPVQGLQQWYAAGVQFNGVRLGTVAVHLPESGLNAYMGALRLRLAMVTVLLALLAGVLVYRFSGGLSRSMCMLSDASQKVGEGDFLAQVHGEGRWEIGQAMRDFNRMVSQLARREAVRELFGRYEKPEQVADAFDRKLINTKCPSRNVAVMVVSMADFPAYISTEGGYDALAGLNRFFDILTGIISQCGGHIDYLSGDRLVAVFNHPANLKNYEQQAALSALAVVEVSKKLSLPGADGGTAAFRVGLSQGEVFTGYLGAGRHREFRAAGAAVALAEQLALLAEGDEVLAGGELLQQLGYGFIRQDMGVLTVAGGRELHSARITGTTERIRGVIQNIVTAAFDRVEKRELRQG